MKQRLNHLARRLNLVKLNFYWQLRVGGALAVGALLVSFALIIGFQLNADRETQMANHSNRVLKRLEKLLLNVVQMESAARGFAITGEVKMCPDIDSSIQSTKNNYVELIDLTEDNARQNKLIRNLQGDLEERFHIINEMISHKRIFKTNDTTTTELVTLGIILSQKLTKDIELIKNHERNLLEKRLQMYRRSSSISLTIIGVTLFSSVVILGILFILLKNEFRVRQEHESRLYRQQLELEEKIAKLNSSNEALEQFAYVASHDLQEPLRKIHSFSDRLMSKSFEHLDEDSRHYLDRIANAAERMRQLISDLLKFSRIAQYDVKFGTVDLNQVLSTVLDDLEPVIQGKKAIIETAKKLKTIRADGVQMAQLFQNLIGNGLKFSRPGIPPEIKIKATTVSFDKMKALHTDLLPADYYCIEIADNGIGFDDKYLDRIFAIFQRLHDRSAYEGTGIGLAVCKKIVENHNGFIDARSTPGEGSNFLIYLPLIN